MLSTDPVFQELYRRDIAERRMKTFPAVERFDVVKQVSGCLRPSAVAGAMHRLILKTVEEALGRRVVPEIPFAAHRADHAVLFQPRLKGVAGILASPLRVMNQTRRRLSAEPGHG